MHNIFLNAKGPAKVRDPNKSRSQKKDGRVIMKYGRIVHNEEIHGEDPTDLAELGNT